MARNAQATPRSAHGVVDANEFVKELREPLRFAVDPILSQGGLLLLFGPPGIGKSWLAQQALLCIASAQPFLRWSTRQLRCLYATTELSEPALRKRARKALGNYTVPNGYMFYAREGVENIHEPMNMERLKRMAADVDVLCLDPLLDAVGGEVLSIPLMTRVTQDLRRLGKTVILVNHTRKARITDFGPMNLGMDESIGVVVAAAKADAILQMRSVRGRMRLLIEKARHAEEREEGLTITWDGEKALWLPEAVDIGVGSVLELVSSKERSLPEVIKELAIREGKSEQTARRMVMDAEKHGAVRVTTGKGRGGGTVRRV